MGKSKKRKKENARKKQRRTAKYLAGGKKSKYAKKYEYLTKHGLWGWEVKDKSVWGA